MEKGGRFSPFLFSTFLVSRGRWVQPNLPLGHTWKKGDETKRDEGGNRRDERIHVSHWTQYETASGDFSFCFQVADGKWKALKKVFKSIDEKLFSDVAKLIQLKPTASVKKKMCCLTEMS